MICLIFKYSIDFKVYSLILKVLDKSVVRREPMSMLSLKRGIQVIYIIWLKRGCSHLVKVSYCLTRFNPYIILD